jgi:UDP:flavonoid glycosyltransferase YjiC (YdhE family)
MKKFIAFAAPPFAGHLNPLASLAQTALEAGYRVEVLTGAAKVDVLRSAGLPAAGLSTLAPSALEAIADTPHRVGSNPLRLAGQMRQAFALIAPVRDELSGRWREDRPDLVVADFAAVPAGLAAQPLQIPWITTLRPPFVLETRSGPPSYLGGLRPMAGLLGRLRDALGWSLVRGAKDTLAFVFANEMERLGLKRLRPDGSESIYSPLALLATTMRELEFTQAWPGHLRFLGPCSRNPEQALRLALPELRPRVLVTFGTHLPWAKERLLSETERLAELVPQVAFVVSLGESARIAPAPIDVRGRVHVFSFVPYDVELPDFDAVIHHGGAGIVYAAIAAERPSLVFPQDYDQFDYAARIEHFGLGVRIARIGSQDAAHKLTALLKYAPPGLARMASAARAYRPGETFLAAVHEIVETGQLS